MENAWWIPNESLIYVFLINCMVVFLPPTTIFSVVYLHIFSLSYISFEERLVFNVCFFHTTIVLNFYIHPKLLFRSKLIESNFDMHIVAVVIFIPIKLHLSLHL